MLARATALCLLVALWPTMGAARDYAEGFEDGQPGWRITLDKAAARTLTQRRTDEIRHEGNAAEQIVVESRAAVTKLRFEHALPAARLIDELVLSLWFHSSLDGAQLQVRVVLPNETDPRSGQPLVLLIEGDMYTRTNQWQKLECRDMKSLLVQSLPRIRQEILARTGAKLAIDQTGMYVDGAALLVQMGRGTAQFVVDELSFGPIVEAVKADGVRPVAAESEPAQREVEIKGDRLTLRKRPFFPRIVPFHGERPDELARMRLNTVWVPDYSDTPLIEAMKAAGIYSMAAPPRAEDDDGLPLDPQSAELPPFQANTAAILFWFMGMRIPPESKDELVSWVEQVQNADRELRRPIMGDVAGLEREYSRQISMLGASRSALFSSLTPRDYRDWLLERRHLAWPGTFFWTWVPTEALPSVADQRTAAGWSPLVVEPEQLRQQVYAALAAGCKAIAYWTHAPLGSDGPGMRERQLMISLLNMELELLEPWLATARLGSRVPFSANLPPAEKPGAIATPSGSNRSPGELHQKLANNANQARTRSELSHNLEASILQTQYGLLALPLWYADDAMFVPGQMAANDARIVVPGVGESAQVYEISTTKIETLRGERVTGGTQVTLRKFDQTSAILFTDDPGVVERLKEKVAVMAETSARVSLEIARLKLDRTAEVDQRLRAYMAGLKDGPHLLASARQQLQHAEAALGAHDFHAARMHANSCMQLMRMLQHAHWSLALRRSSPVTSPHTLCFQTLPDHYEMISRLGRATKPQGKNLLRSGDFEDYDTMIAEGWRREESEIPGVRSIAELYPKPRAGSGKYCLRLIAGLAVGHDPPTVVTERPVTVVTPPVTVYKGQIVYISGWVKMASPSLASLDGALLYDSLGGRPLALRWTKEADWKRFELIREVFETTEMTVTMTLSGLGDVRFDDLQIVPLETAGVSPAEQNSSPGRTNAAGGGVLDFFKFRRSAGGKPPPQ